MTPRQTAARKLFDDPEFRARHKQGTRNAVAIKWDDGRDDKLISLYRGGAAWRVIQREMGLTHTTCIRRLREIGLYQPRKPGPARRDHEGGQEPDSNLPAP